MSASERAGLPEHEEVWSFRAECWRDVLCGWAQSFHWADNGIFMKRLEVEQWEEFPDVIGHITLRALDGEKILNGLKALAAEIRKYPDTHVLLETLKPEHHYDGERNGPFEAEW